jgi:hypothetical protein
MKYAYQKLAILSESRKLMNRSNIIWKRSEGGFWLGVGFSILNVFEPDFTIAMTGAILIFFTVIIRSYALYLLDKATRLLK